MAKRYRAIAAYYDAEYADSRMLQEDVPFFLGSLPAGKRLSVLELCVGTGRAAIPIAQAGHRVVGVDYDPALLEIGQQKRAAAGLKEAALSLIHGDVLDFSLGRRFDRVCIFFNTLLAFPTVEEQSRLLQKRGGLISALAGGFGWTSSIPILRCSPLSRPVGWSRRSSTCPHSKGRCSARPTSRATWSARPNA